jgi:hypothetical protein
METVKIPDTFYVRDIHSKALLNTDKKGLNEYLIQKEIAKKQNEKSKRLNEKIEKLEEDVFLIKNILLELKTSLVKNAD